MDFISGMAKPLKNQTYQYTVRTTEFKFVTWNKIMKALTPHVYVFCTLLNKNRNNFLLRYSSLYTYAGHSIYLSQGIHKCDKALRLMLVCQEIMPSPNFMISCTENQTKTKEHNQPNLISQSILNHSICYAMLQNIVQTQTVTTYLLYYLSISVCTI